MVISDCCITTRMIELGITKGRVQTILKDDLNMREMCAKIVPKVLTEKQKQRRAACCQDWIEGQEVLDFLYTTIIRNESWIY